ncbi:MAG TPA: superoxide dismutase [Sulfurovum sp.]|nr:superoxide dismutase [Sulfurovum sp.]
MKHVLMELPFDENALEPYISAETIQYHYGRHHKGYLTKLNALIEGSPFEEMSLEEIIKKSGDAIFNNASQVYNHDFYFSGMSMQKSEPSRMLKEWIERDFGSIEIFKKSFLESAAGLFGSGWVWLSVNRENHLIIESRSNADNPILYGHTPLLTCDVWEHAYYIDYRNARADYLEKWWELINWDVVSERFGEYHYIEFPCDDNSGECEFREER